MEDSEIVRLYWERSEQAVPETAAKYGGYCTAIARNILHSPEDAEECVNDTWLGAWNAMPPHRPEVLSTFLGRITRNLSVNRWKRDRADKRGGGGIGAVLDELEQCVSGRDDVEQALDRKELIGAINGFLDALPPDKRGIFLCRYWYSDSISDIAARYSMREGAVSMALNRLRAKLRRYLAERGFEL